MPNARKEWYFFQYSLVLAMVIMILSCEPPFSDVVRVTCSTNTDSHVTCM